MRYVDVSSHCFIGSKTSYESEFNSLIFKISIFNGNIHRGIEDRMGYHRFCRGDPSASRRRPRFLVQMEPRLDARHPGLHDGELTFCNGIVKTEDGVISATIDIRFPVTYPQLPFLLQ